VAGAAGTEKNLSDPLPERPTVADVTAALAVEINRVRASKVDALARARCVGYLAGVLLKALETGDLAERIEKLEQHFTKKDGRQ